MTTLKHHHHIEMTPRARPWLENAVQFWRWFQSQTLQPKQ